MGEERLYHWIKKVYILFQKILFKNNLLEQSSAQTTAGHIPRRRKTQQTQILLNSNILPNSRHSFTLNYNSNSEFNGDNNFVENFKFKV